MISFQETHFGVTDVTLEALPSWHRHIRNSKRPRITRQLTCFTPKAQRRLKKSLGATRMPVGTTFFATLKFREATLPAEARRLLKDQLRWFRRKFPNAGGFYSLEFSNLHKIHYHIILIFNDAESEKAKLDCEKWSQHWCKLTGGLEFPYAEVLRCQKEAARYLSKSTEQRVIPTCFLGQITKFWGKFGTLHPLPCRKVALPTQFNQRARSEIAMLVREQQTHRSEAFAYAIESSSRRVSAYLTRTQAELLISWLEKQHESRPESKPEVTDSGKCIKQQEERNLSDPISRPTIDSDSKPRGSNSRHQQPTTISHKPRPRGRDPPFDQLLSFSGLYQKTSPETQPAVFRCVSHSKFIMFGLGEGVPVG